jgi:hypothetical protein
LHFHGNNIAPFQAYDPVISTAADIPANWSGLFYSYVPELAKEDPVTVMQVIETYFRGFLGQDGETVLTVFEELKSAWGNLRSTKWGHELTHLYKCIQIAFEAGTAIKVIVTPDNLYAGCLLMGGGYVLSVAGHEFSPRDNGVLVAEFDLASPHQNALTTIKGLINYPDDLTRQNATLSVNALRNDAIRYGYDVNDRQEILDNCGKLCFPNSTNLSVNAFNIQRICQAIVQHASGPLPEGTLIHPTNLLERDNRKALWSGFGPFAPTFRVPNGKSMGLDEPFSVSRAIGGGRSKVSVAKIACQLVPLDRAQADLELMISTKTILNPHGTNVMNRNSSGAILRDYEGNHADIVIGALRSIAGVNVVNTGGTGNGRNKRGRDEDDDTISGRSKKARVAAVFDF